MKNKLTQEQISLIKKYERPQDECFSFNFGGGLYDYCDLLDITWVMNTKPVTFHCLLIDKEIEKSNRAPKCTDYDFAKKLLELL